MATTKIGRKKIDQDEFIDTVFDLGEWLEKKWRPVAAGSAVVVVVVLFGLGWMSWREAQGKESNRLLAEGLAAYEPAADAEGKTPAPDYATALPLFERAAAKGGSRVIGDVARFYRARTMMALGRAADAVPILEKVARSADDALAAQAKVSLSQALAASGNADRAATILTEVAAATDGAYPPDAALAALAELKAGQGKKDEARKTYEELLTRFPQSPFADEARRNVGAQPGAAR
jgi:predicted negative regulator of RcsB-dependent stress response